MMAQLSSRQVETELATSDNAGLSGVMDNTIRIARLKLLFIAGKLVSHANRDKLKYSIHDSRTPGLMHFFDFLDKTRSKVRPWIQGALWPCRFSLVCI